MKEFTNLQIGFLLIFPKRCSSKKNEKIYILKIRLNNRKRAVENIEKRKN